ncbi:ketopantoate reductase family protein [Cellulosilyticum sp. I15G10I2]|uniref:ketopantoate reductase family protein n=1 Tax=Cellulosilyticum sp. I15G10I2 TaxID=1892843 RepID=UPI00085C3C97|nr:2-dehydropantoate 2-reductase N-terminal domain-containing protein [Cellulosilyticum sp. I15G10I2]
MKILMVGRGVIATQYAWALKKAGNEVEFYVRPGRAAQYGPLVDLNIIDGRKKRTLVKEKWSITMREELAPDHDYDLIVVSVNHYQLDGVLDFLVSRVNKATVLMFNNLWIDPQKVVSLLPKDQVVWGFPGAGGGYSSAGTLNGGFMKMIYMGFVGDTSVTKRYQNVRILFEKAGFSIAQRKDFHSWLLVHFVINAGIAAQALKIGGYDKVFDSTVNLKETIILVREMLPLIRAKGGKISLGTYLAMYLPSGIIGLILKKAMAKGSIARDIMSGMFESDQFNLDTAGFFPKDVLADARMLGISLPRLTALQSVF